VWRGVKEDEMTKQLEDLMCRHPMVVMAAADDAVKTSIVLKGGDSAEQVLSWLTNPKNAIASHLLPRQLEILRSFSDTTEARLCEPGERGSVLRAHQA
jgi:hypothetical protein